MKIPDLTALREAVRKNEATALHELDHALASAREVILIGSSASETSEASSDIDLLLIGNGEKTKTRILDLVWVGQERTSSRSWLGSELANHAARYGKWLKGKGAWRRRVFISETAIVQKCERVLERLCRLYLKRNVLARSSMARLALPSVLDMERARLMGTGVPVPSTYRILELFVDAPQRTLSAMKGRRYLGKLGEFFITEFLPTEAIIKAARSELVRRKRSIARSAR